MGTSVAAFFLNNIPASNFGGGGRELFKSTGPSGQWIQQLNVKVCWSSVNEQYTDPATQSVAIQPDEQCDTMSHSERVILLVHMCLSDELPATDSLVLHTVSRLSALAQADYTVPVAPQPGFPFSEARKSLSENSTGIKKPSGGQITPICFGTSLQRGTALSIRAFFYRFSVFTGLPCCR